MLATKFLIKFSHFHCFMMIMIKWWWSPSSGAASDHHHLPVQLVMIFILASWLRFEVDWTFFTNLSSHLLQSKIFSANDDVDKSGKNILYKDKINPLRTMRAFAAETQIKCNVMLLFWFIHFANVLEILALKYLRRAHSSSFCKTKTFS